MSKQKQKASGKSIAIQSGRDVIIEGGIRPEDMKAILESQNRILEIYSLRSGIGFVHRAATGVAFWASALIDVTRQRRWVPSSGPRERTRP